MEAYKYRGKLYLFYLPQHYYSIPLDGFDNLAGFQWTPITQTDFENAKNGIGALPYTLLNGFTVSFINRAGLIYPQIVNLLDHLEHEIRNLE